MRKVLAGGPIRPRDGTLHAYKRVTGKGIRMRRVKLPLTPQLEVEFADRERGVQQVLEWSEKGTRFPIVVFGPEGCGKTA
jgi:hypothetical protein